MALGSADAGLRPALARSLTRTRSRTGIALRSLNWRHGIFALTLALYAALTVLVVIGWSPLMRLDVFITQLRMDRRWPGVHRFMLDYVMFGQRAPSTLLALPWFLWICYRRRSFTPLIRLATGLLLLNISVGIVKIETGRYGPMKTADAHRVFDGGNIFPSGHVSNAVVLYGVMAMCAVRYRKQMIALAGWLCTTVGFTTLYLNTHWLTDVVAAWFAGGLVLMVLPLCVPRVERVLYAVTGWVRRRCLMRAPSVPPPAPRPVPSDGSPAHPAGSRGHREPGYAQPTPAGTRSASGARVTGVGRSTHSPRVAGFVASAVRSVERTADRVGHRRRGGAEQDQAACVGARRE